MSNIGTKNNPLKLTSELTTVVNKAWDDGSLYDNVSPVTQDLLRFWFSPSFSDIRDINFHEGQKQAILNIIYLHEILGVSSVKDLYLNVYPELLKEMDLDNIEQEKYNHPMYAVKMATGTGKTWVMHALLLWQYLNSYKNPSDNRFSKNFLIVAPGIIVYNRLLDAFLGKEDVDNVRDFNTSDFMKFKELFIPDAYRDLIFGFLQTSVACKDEISSKVCGDGLVAITNWHLLIDKDDEENLDSPLDNPAQVLKNVLPVSPGKASGNDLSSLDSAFLRGSEIEYLKGLDKLVVINDEAHHIHTFKRGGEVFEVEWQKSLNKISEFKDSFIQIDFSATPYSNSGGKKKVKHYFPHVIVDFDLRAAIHKGLVKMIAIDRREEVSSIKLDFKAEREGNKIVDLSDGQRLMLRAGYKKLKILEDEFKHLDVNKHPKMLVMCEDTKVAPFVTRFFKSEGLSSDEIVEIHSNKKGEISEDDWNSIKQRLFNVDNYENPKIIVSVLMLREGFDVNNICVIVPLRSTESEILLEQTIGRGLRLMWREHEYDEVKYENRRRVLKNKLEPENYLDLLSIIEHPNFIKFYEESLDDDVVIEITEDEKPDKILGDMINVPLRDDFEEFDFYWPFIIQESEEILTNERISIDNFEPYKIPLEELQKIKGEGGEKFKSHEITVRTQFGEYNVSSDIFTAKNYNEFLSRIINNVNAMLQNVGRGSKAFPMIQVNNAEITGVIDEYIRTKLFNEPFDPMINENWRILVMSDGSIIKHITKQISRVMYELQNNVRIEEAVVDKIPFSKVDKLRMRENYSIDVNKSIYPKLPYPSNKGGFEKSFIEALDNDGYVNSFLKINEYYHDFACITYIRDDGLLARYYPDFIVKINNDIYIVETKSDKDINSENVQRKRIATLDALDKINQLKGVDRMDSKWNYTLLGENTFYSMFENSASIKEILDYNIVNESIAKGHKTLDDFMN